MIRILHVAECKSGGVPLFVRRLTEGLKEEIAFGIACPPSSELCTMPPTKSVIFPVEMPHRVSPLGDLMAAWRLRGSVRFGGYDVLHLNSSKAGLIGVLAKRGLAARLIFTPHALRSQAYPHRSLPRAAARLVEKIICTSVDIVVAVSPDEEQQLIKGGLVPAGKVRLIENGVDLDEMDAPAAASRESIGVPADAFIVGAVGRLCAQKDPVTFVQAAGALAAQIPEAHFVVLGDGPLEKDVRHRVASMGIEDRFHLLGWRDDARDVLKLFDVFVLTSRYEGMPFALLEAAGARKPLVCTAAAGVRSLIRHGKNGLISEVGDWQGIADSVSFLYRDEAVRSRLAAEAWESIARPRSLENMLGRWNALYQSLVEDVVPTAAAEAAPVQ